MSVLLKAALALIMKLTITFFGVFVERIHIHTTDLLYQVLQVLYEPSACCDLDVLK